MIFESKASDSVLEPGPDASRFGPERGAPVGVQRDPLDEMGLCSPEEAVEEIRAGRMLVLVDGDSGENPGDLCIAADAVTPEAINFMATHARGLICLALDPATFDRLGVSLMVPEHANESARSTAFGISIEARAGVTTGISAYDRAHTIRTAIADGAGPGDLSRPGHIFPLQARPHGVLERPGRTEGSVDLARLAGRRAGAAICEIMNDDGSVARSSDLQAFAKQHGLKIASIADLVQHRMRSEPLVHPVAEAMLPTAWGEFRAVVFRGEIDGVDHIALIRGQLRPEVPGLVRVHRECLTGDAFGSSRCDCGAQLDAALERLGAAESGVLLYLRREGRDTGLANQIKAYALQDADDRAVAHERLGSCCGERDDGVAAGMLRSLGIRRLRQLTSHAEKPTQITQFGLEVCERIALEITPNERDLPDLRAKKDKLGHLLPRHPRESPSRSTHPGARRPSMAIPIRG